MDWEQELKDIVRMQRILESTDTELKVVQPRRYFIMIGLSSCRETI